MAHQVPHRHLQLGSRQVIFCDGQESLDAGLDAVAAAEQGRQADRTPHGGGGSSPVVRSRGYETEQGHDLGRLDGKPRIERSDDKLEERFEQFRSPRRFLTMQDGREPERRRARRVRVGCRTGGGSQA